MYLAVFIIRKGVNPTQIQFLSSFIPPSSPLNPPLENRPSKIRKHISAWFHVVSNTHQGLPRGNQLLQRAFIYGPEHEPGVYERVVGLRVDVDGVKVAVELDPVLDFPLLEPRRSLGGRRSNDADVCLDLLGGIDQI